MSKTAGSWMRDQLLPRDLTHNKKNVLTFLGRRSPFKV